MGKKRVLPGFLLLGLALMASCGEKSKTSSSQDAAISPLAPDAPSFLVAQGASSSQIDLTWTDGSDDESGFSIERSSDGNDYAEMATIGPDATAYSDTGLGPLTGYHYRVRAFNDEGPSAWSNTAYGITLADELHYVRAGAAGSNDGTDWTNAWTDLPAGLIRGHVYFIAGGSYGEHHFRDAESGSQFIEIRKATAADHGTDTGWDASFAGAQALFPSWEFSRSFYIFDGRTGGGPASWQEGLGIKVGSGDPERMTMTMHGPDAWGEDLPHHLRFLHVELEGGLANLELDEQGVATVGPAEIVWSISPDSGHEGPSHIYIGYSYLHDAAGMVLNTTRGNDWVVEYSYFARNHSDPVYHSECWQAQGGKRVVVRHNIFEDIEGTAFLAIKKNSNNDHDDWKIHGNIFFHSPGFEGSIGGNGAIGVSSGSTTNTSTTSNILIYNNTFANIRGYNVGVYLCEGGEGTYFGNYVYDNIWYNNISHTIGFTGVEDHDYNWFYGNIDDRFEEGNPSRDLDTLTLEGSPEANGEIGAENPFLDPQSGDFRLSLAIPGLVLDAEYGTDMYGNTRGADGAWDRGALELLP